MLDPIRVPDVNELATFAAPYCVSLFMPTHPASVTAPQDQLHLKNLLSQAAEELAAEGLNRADVDGLLGPAAALVGDVNFWSTVEAGLAMYTAAGRFQSFRLPRAVDQLVVVTGRFHVKPLLAEIGRGEAYALLALSQNEVRLLRGGRLGLREMALGDIPASLAAALRFDDRERQLQSHGAGKVGAGRVAAMFHGHGRGRDTRDADLDRFFRAIDDGVVDLLAAGPSLLVLAGLPEHVARYRRLTRRSDVIDGAVVENPDGLSAAELHARAWPIVAALTTAERTDAAETWFSGSGPTLSSVAETVLAAIDGRVEVLFVPADVQHWGTADLTRRAVIEYNDRLPGAEDLLNRAAIESLSRDGRVHVVAATEVPGPGPVAAMLRY